MDEDLSVWRSVQTCFGSFVAPQGTFLRLACWITVVKHVAWSCKQVCSRSASAKAASPRTPPERPANLPRDGPLCIGLGLDTTAVSLDLQQLWEVAWAQVPTEGPHYSGGQSSVAGCSVQSQLSSMAVVGVGRFSAVEWSPADPVQPLRQAVPGGFCGIARHVPQRVVGIQVSHNVGRQEIRVKEILSFMSVSRSNGLPEDVENVQGFRSEETNSARLHPAISEGQLVLCQQGKLETCSQVQGNISSLCARHSRSSPCVPGDDRELEPHYSRQCLAELAHLDVCFFHEEWKLNEILVS